LVSSIRSWRLSHVLPTWVYRFFAFLDTERALLREFIFIFFLFLLLFHTVLILFILFFSVTLLFFCTFLGIFVVSLLHDFWVQIVLLLNNFMHSHYIVVFNDVAKDLGGSSLLWRLLSVVVGVGLTALLFLSPLLAVLLA